MRTPVNYLHDLARWTIVKYAYDHLAGYEIEADDGSTATFERHGGYRASTFGSFTGDGFGFDIWKAGMGYSTENITPVIVFMLKSAMITMRQVRDAVSRKSSLHDEPSALIRDKFAFIAANKQYKIRMSDDLALIGPDAEEADTLRIVGLK